MITTPQHGRPYPWALKALCYPRVQSAGDPISEHNTVLGGGLGGRWRGGPGGQWRGGRWRSWRGGRGGEVVEVMGDVVFMQEARPTPELQVFLTFHKVVKRDKSMEKG